MKNIKAKIQKNKIGRLIFRRSKKVFLVFLGVILIFSSIHAINTLRPRLSDAAWWNDSWAYRLALTIDNSKIDENLTNFPVLVKLTSSQLSFTQVKSNGEDIRFTDIGGNVLDYEIERWDTDDSLAEVWVKVPTVNSSTDTIIYMYYGNAQAQDAQNPVSVWSNGYSHVFHLNNSTLNSVNGNTSRQAFGANGVDAMGQIAQGRNKQSNYTGTVFSSTEPRKSTNLTIEAWYKPDGFRDWDDVASQGWVGNGWVLYDNVDGRVLWGVASGGTQTNISDGAIIEDDEWAYLSGTYDGETSTLYVNGSSSGTPKSVSGAATDITSQITSINNTDRGTVDEIRISSIARSAAWIKASYNSDNNTLLSFGDEEKGNGPSIYFAFDEGYGTATRSNSGETTVKNLFANPSFETNTTGWGAIGTADIARITTESKFGVASLEVDTNANADGARYIMDGDNNSPQNTTYTVSFWIKAKTASDVGKNPQYFIEPRGGGTYENFSGNILLTQNWQQVVRTFTWANSGHTGWAFTVRDASSQSPFSFQVDGFHYEQSPVANPYCDGGAGGDTNYTSSSWNGTANASTSTCSSTLTAALLGTTPPPWQTPDMCISGNCLGFNGSNQYVSIPNNERANFSDAFTIQAWIKVTSIASETNYNIVSKQIWGDMLGYRLALAGYGGGENSLFFGVGNGSSRTEIQSGVKINNLNTWYHVAATFDNGVMKQYVNGKLVNTYNSVVTSITNTSGPLTIARHSSGGEFFPGFIDDVKLYPYARSDDQIRVDFNSRGGSSATVLGETQRSNFSQGLVGYWKMDEASWNGTTGEVKDSSGSSNNGTANGAQATSSAKFGNAGYFDGSDDYVNIPGSASININTEITLSTWIKFNGLTDNMIFISKRDPTSTEGSMQFNTDNAGRLRFCFVVSTFICRSTSETGLITTGQWYHVSVVHKWGNGNATTIYINGQPKTMAAWQQGTGNENMTANNNAIRLGYSANAGTGINGIMDETRIYNRVLSSAEISQLYNFESQPVGYWNFEEGKGNTVNDKSGNNHTGIWNGSGTLWTS